MALEELLGKVDQIKRAIAEHRSLLAGNERETRAKLIDPLLRELGWDTADSTAVNIEHRAPSRGIADYVLMVEGEDFAVVEAKKLDERLAPPYVTQALNYGNERGTRYTVITNGNDWRIYETFEKAPADTRPFRGFNIERDDRGEIVLKAAVLWRGGLTRQSARTEGRADSKTDLPEGSLQKMEKWSGYEWQATRIAYADRDDAKEAAEQHRREGYNAQIERVPGNAEGGSPWGEALAPLVGYFVIWRTTTRVRAIRKAERAKAKAEQE